MGIFFTPLFIFITTCVGFLVGSIWYSPILFMKAWMKGEGVTQEKLPKRGKVYLLQINLYSFIAHGAIASVLAVLFEILSITSLSVAVSLGLLLTLGFIVTTRFIDMLYTVNENHYHVRPQVKFLVASGYYLVTVTVMSAVLFLVAH